MCNIFNYLFPSGVLITCSCSLPVSTLDLRRTRRCEKRAETHLRAPWRADDEVKRAVCPLQGRRQVTQPRFSTSCNDLSVDIAGFSILGNPEQELGVDESLDIIPAPLIQNFCSETSFQSLRRVPYSTQQQQQRRQSHSTPTARSLLPSP